MKKICSFLFVVLVSFNAFSQASTVKSKKSGWHLMDERKDGYKGISLNPAYELLKGRKSTTVIVAVIDSGIDTLHEDLRPILWRNEKEVNGNGKDDDGNGYIDDVYGWNFCGAPTGENVVRNSHEIARVYHNWKAEFEGKKEKSIPEDKKFLYSQWVKAAGIIEKEYTEAKKVLERSGTYYKALEISSKTLTNHLSKNAFGPNDLQPLLSSTDESVSRSAALWTDLFSRVGDTSIKNTAILDDITSYKNSLENQVNRKLTPPEEWRGALVKDRYTDINDRFYGNNNLKSGSGDHGTLVSGTIAAVRNNAVGMDGIADNVRIMAIRAVPGGDEHDKDVALAIRYAVDNGAKIINMSFGKPVSPYKHMVDDAVRYAATKGVLLVHGSGNDGKDISKDVFYPNPLFLDNTRATNYLTVGASGDLSTGGLAAPFSNYSKEWVDLFAPGMNIYATATDNRYNAADGTSLASPVVSGVAALLKSYFPQLTPEQMVHILTHAGAPIQEEVVQPGTTDKKVKFTSLSSSGRIVNAYEAVKMALEMESGKKPL